MVQVTSFKSSTKRESKLSKPSGKSFINIRKSKGPRTVPWGTPDETLKYLEYVDPTLTSDPLSDGKSFTIENFQKKCIKWILSELELSYSNEVYLRKCKQVNILPLLYRFMFNDMNLFHKVVYKIIPVTMPDYLTLYSRDSRLRRPQYTP